MRKIDLTSSPGRSRIGNPNGILSYNPGWRGPAEGRKASYPGYKTQTRLRLVYPNGVTSVVREGPRTSRLATVFRQNRGIKMDATPLG